MRTLFNGELPALVLFDLDGTLLDSVPDLALAVDRMLLDLGLPVAGIEQVRNWVGNGAQMLVQRALTGVQSPRGDEPELVRFEQAFKQFLDHYGACSARQSKLYPGALELLQYLQQQQVAMALVTNKPIGFTEPLLRKFDLDGFFQLVLGGDSLERKKPDPLPLLHAMQELGVTPEQALMVGDSRSDIYAAQAADCPVAAVTYGYNHGEPVVSYQPDLLVDRLDQLIG